jgi:hypothetical protein
MLNPRINSWGSFEAARRRAEERKQQREPELRKTHWAPGSVEWQAEQDKMKSGPIPVTPAEEL